MSVVAEFAISDDAFPIPGTVAAHDGLTVEVDRLVPLGNQPLYFWLVGDQQARDEVVAELLEPGTGSGVEVIDELPDRVLLRNDEAASGTSFLRTVEEANAIVLSAEGSTGEWVVRLRFPSREKLVALAETCRELGVGLELRATHEAEPDGTDASSQYDLSTKQTETLRLALAEGYFNVPREVSIRELAEQLGVSDQAVSERLRRGVSALIDTTIRDQPDAGSSDEQRTF